MTREDILQRFEATRKKKQEYITKLEKELKAEFKKRTGCLLYTSDAADDTPV